MSAIEPDFAILTHNPRTELGAGNRSPGAALPKEALLTVKETAAALRVCTATVYEMCKVGRLSHVRVMGAIRVHRCDVEALLVAHDPRRS